VLVVPDLGSKLLVVPVFEAGDQIERNFKFPEFVDGSRGCISVEQTRKTHDSEQSRTSQEATLQPPDPETLTTVRSEFTSKAMKLIFNLKSGLLR
jgi:hypothetical protein